MREPEERGTEERGEKERAPFSSCPLQREWPLTLCISLKSVHPPHSLSGAQAAASPALAIQAQVQSTAGWRERETDREKGLRGEKGRWGEQRPWTYATTTGTGTAVQRPPLCSPYSSQTFLLLQSMQKK